MPHSIASLSLPVPDSDGRGFDHTRKVDYSSDSEEILQVNGHSSEERLGNTYLYVNNEKTLRQLLPTRTRCVTEKLECQKCAVVARRCQRQDICYHEIKALLVGNPVPACITQHLVALH